MSAPIRHVVARVLQQAVHHLCDSAQDGFRAGKTNYLHPQGGYGHRDGGCLGEAICDQNPGAASLARWFWLAVGGCLGGCGLPWGTRQTSPEWREVKRFARGPRKRVTGTEFAPKTPQIGCQSPFSLRLYCSRVSSLLPRIRPKFTPFRPVPPLILMTRDWKMSREIFSFFLPKSLYSK